MCNIAYTDDGRVIVTDCNPIKESLNVKRDRTDKKRDSGHYEHFFGMDNNKKTEIDKLLAPTGTPIQFWVEKVIDRALDERYIPGIDFISGRVR